MPIRCGCETVAVRRQGVRRAMTSVVEHAVGRDRGVVLVGGLTVAVGEHAARLLDDRRGPRPRRTIAMPTASIGHVDRALGDEHVLPEVAEPTGSPAALLQFDEPAGQTEPVPTVVERHAHLGVGECRRRPRRGSAARRRTRRGRGPPTTADRAPAPTPPRRPRRASTMGERDQASPTPGCPARSRTCRRSDRRSTATVSRRRR